MRLGIRYGCEPVSCVALDIAILFCCILSLILHRLANENQRSFDAANLAIDSVRFRSSIYPQLDSWRKLRDLLAGGTCHASSVHVARHASLQRISECCVSAACAPFARQSTTYK